MNKKLTQTRILLAIISTGLEETAIWAIWRRVLPEFGIIMPIALLIAVMTAWLAFSAGLFIFTTRVLRKQAQRGLTSMIGTRGIVSSTLGPDGMVKIRGELWKAVAEEGQIEEGTDIVVVGENGLTLMVRKAGK
jgi:membrane-bound serine protease (ClpP class)